MKRLICLMLCLTVVISFGGCKKKPKTAEDFKDVTVVIADGSAIPEEDRTTGKKWIDDGTFNYKKLEKSSGIDLEIKKYDQNEKHLKILAGDDDVDIYFVGAAEAKLFAEMGVPAVIDSEIIAQHNADCFDVLADFCKNDRGEIIFMPMKYVVDAVFVPNDVVSQYNLKAEDIEYLDGYLDFAKNNMSDERMPYGYCFDLMYNMADQYDSYYCNFANNEFNYDTPLFRELCQTLLDDWNTVGEWEYHSPWYAENLWNSPYGAANSQNTLIATGTFGDINKSLNGFFMNWKAYPTPKLDENVDNPFSGGTFLMINPYSKNKEAATLVLEALSKNLIGLQGSNGGCDWIYKNVDRYPENINTESQMFKDYIAIGESYNIMTHSVDNSANHCLWEYVSQKMTLDEMISERSRIVEIWLKE